jgi:hypothetical protein
LHGCDLSSVILFAVSVSPFTKDYEIKRRK